ncbi:MAG: DMT family transporter [Alphaproteobacteria bacterium]|nr:MAG: DMT family transporter [Alphaproteobacteria bacterium]
MAPRHLFLVLVIALIWGTNFVIAKIGMGEFPPFLFTGLRFAFLAIVLAPFLKWHPGRMATIVRIGVLAGGFHFAFFFAGLAVSSASVAAIVVQLNAPFATLMSVVFLKEQVGWRRWSGIGLAVGGVTVISFDPAVFSYLGGMALMALSALMYGISTIFMRRLRGVGVFELQSWTAVLSLPILLAMSLIFEHGQIQALAQASWAGWTTVVYTAIFASLVGHGGMYYLYQRYEVSTVAPMMLASPLIGIISGVLFLDEALTIRVLIGGISVLIGVGIIALRQRPQKPLEAINEQS